MGVLTDLILATEAELAAVDPEDVPINVLPGLDIKGTGLIELATLFAIATGRGVEPDLEAFPEVSGNESDDGPWVFRCPDELVSALAAAGPEELKRIADAWARTDEVRLSSWPRTVVDERLRDMSAFAAKALAAGKPVHIWTSP